MKERDENAGIGSMWVFDPASVWPSLAKIEITIEGDVSQGLTRRIMPDEMFVILKFADADGVIRVLHKGIVGWFPMKFLGACKRIV